MRFHLLLIILGVFYDSTYSQIQSNKDALPSFDDFPVTVTQNTPARIRWESNRGSKRFRTVIKEGVRDGVNFAGHYHIAEWGCGTACQSWVIIDMKTGNIYDGIPTSRGLEYRTNSTMIILNPGPRDYNSATDNVDPEYMVWKNNKLRPVHSQHLKDK